MKKIQIILLFCLFTFGAKAQFLEDKQSTEQVLRGLDFLYNQQFSQAEAAFAPVKIKYADHPVRFLLNALQIQWRYIPIDQNATALSNYSKELNNCVLAAEKYYKKPGYKMESTFFLLASHGFLALVQNFKGNYLDAANEARKALKYFKESKNYTGKNPEFLFATGLYNYYREQYPETKPMVKPIMIFFESGNKTKGLSELEKAYRTSVFSRTESAIYLRDIYIKYESNFKKALYFSTQLYKDYPNNFIFRIAQTESLLLNGKFEEAQSINETLKGLRNPVAELSYYTFDGYIQENFLKNYTLAEQAYQNAIKTRANDRYTKDYLALAYLGLARINKTQGNAGSAKNYYKLCLKYAEYLWLVDAAKNELKSLS